MKKVFYLILLFFFQFSYSQLSVRNNAYVYVNDLALYVEDDVNIQESTATIYLRNGSQLLQGAGTTGNSGIGKLSIYQDGKASAAAYNYWCSPVGVSIDGAAQANLNWNSTNMHLPADLIMLDKHAFLELQNINYRTSEGTVIMVPNASVVV